MSSLLILLILALAGCTGRSDTLERIQREGVLRVGIDPSFPPFETFADAEIVGLDVDLARALAAELGARAQFDPIGYDGLYDALATGRVDLLISALVIDPTRTRDFAYSDTYFNAGQVLVTPANTTVQSRNALAGRVLAVELGAQGHVTALDWARQTVDLTVRTYDTPDAALQAVRDGQSAAALVDSVSAILYLANAPELAISDPAVTVEPYAVVVRAEDAALLRALNAALGAMQQDGRLDALRDRWLAAP